MMRLYAFYPTTYKQIIKDFFIFLIYDKMKVKILHGVLKDD